MERGRSLLIFKVKGHISRSLDGYLGNFMWFKSNCWFKLKIYMSGVCCYTQCCSCLWLSLVWPGREANSRPTVWEADTLPTEPTRHGNLTGSHHFPVCDMQFLLRAKPLAVAQLFIHWPFFSQKMIHWCYWRWDTVIDVITLTQPSQPWKALTVSDYAAGHVWDITC